MLLVEGESYEWQPWLVHLWLLQFSPSDALVFNSQWNDSSIFCGIIVEIDDRY